MRNTHIKKLVMAALFAAVICVATAVIAIPLPGNGFANLGDCFVILAGALLGPLWGAAAAAVGSALADLFLGYTLYAPATFLIKGLMALAVWGLFHKVKAPTAVRVPLCAVTSEVIMVGGYCLFELPLYGAAVALADIPGNAVQGLVGACAACVLLPIITKNRMLSKFFE